MRSTQKCPGTGVTVASLLIISMFQGSASELNESTACLVADAASVDNCNQIQDENQWDVPLSTMGHICVDWSDYNPLRPAPIICVHPINLSPTCDKNNTPIEWLAINQAADGHWDSVSFGAHQKIDTIVTSLALLGFLHAGQTEVSGEYKEFVKIAVGWLRSKQDANGRVFDPTDSTHPPEELGCPEALAAQALAEAARYANTPETFVSAQRAINYCLEMRQKRTGPDVYDRGGFSFTPQSPENIMATAWFIMAMRSAKDAGLHVPSSAFLGALHFVDSVTHKTSDASVYWFSQSEERKEKAATQTAMGALIRLFSGARKRHVLPIVREFEHLSGPPGWNNEQDLAYWYIGSLCINRQDNAVVGEWYRSLHQELKTSQEQSGGDVGSWPDKSGRLGRAGQTALNTLCLELVFSL